MNAPMPYFGGKGRIASAVWQRLDDTANFVEPFCGSAAVLLARPDSHRWWERTETVNDADGLLANFWRAVQAAPDAVARHADWPVNENDLHARHAWLVGQKASLQSAIEGDPEHYDAKIAGWWLWGICLWIGSGWCSGNGPWRVVGSQLVHLGDDGQGINRQLVHLGNDGQGINRQRVHLGNDGQGINRQRVHLGNDGQGINRQRVHLGPGSVGTHRILEGVEEDGTGQAERWAAHLQAMMRRLQDRLRRVRVCCGDWSRVCGPTPTFKLGVTGVFLDPPYGDVGRDSDLYRVDDLDVAAKVRMWALENGENPLLRIILCGYEGEHEMPGWTAWRWKAKGGYGSQGEGIGRANAKRECLWLSPHCRKTDMFSHAGVSV